MTDQEFRAIYPSVFGWVQHTLSQYTPAARPVNSLGFRRLPDFYDADTLAKAKAVAVDRVPVPPLSAMGLGRFADFERMDAAGITYLDTYFLRADQAWDESLHFHELVHVIQWRILGPEGFLAAYADGLERFGYRGSPLEVMAYDLQARFDAHQTPFEVAVEVEAQLHRKPTWPEAEA
jgi:hypothetical protein